MRRFGLIGKTLKHSFSQNYFTQKFARENITDCSYSNFELQSIDEVTTLVHTPGLAGFNITIPYKEEILPFLHKKKSHSGENRSVQLCKDHQWSIAWF